MKTLLIIASLFLLGCTRHLHVHYHITVTQPTNYVDGIRFSPNYPTPDISPTPESVFSAPYLIFNPPGDTLWIYPNNIKPKK